MYLQQAQLLYCMYVFCVYQVGFTHGCNRKICVSTNYPNRAFDAFDRVFGLRRSGVPTETIFLILLVPRRHAAAVVWLGTAESSRTYGDAQYILVQFFSLR